MGPGPELECPRFFSMQWGESPIGKGQVKVILSISVMVQHFRRQMGRECLTLLQTTEYYLSTAFHKSDNEMEPL